MSLFVATLSRMRSVLPVRISRSTSPEDANPGPNGVDIPLEKVDTVSAPSMATKKAGDSTAKQELMIQENLARFARIPASALFDLLPNSSPSGMTNEQASVLLKKHGHNLLTSERPQSAWSLFWIAVVNPFNALLIILAVISIATGDKATFSVMMSMVVASTGLRSVFRFLFIS